MIRNETAHLLRRTAPALATLPLALALSGCGTLTGLNAENDFSCPMTPGVSCRSLSDTYEDSVRGRTPDRIERDKAIEAASKGLPEIEGTNGKVEFLDGHFQNLLFTGILLGVHDLGVAGIYVPADGGTDFCHGHWPHDNLVLQ